MRTLQDHLDAALNLDAADIDKLRALAAQLNNHTVMPVVGAGASYDCGMRLARELASDMRADYLADKTFQPYAANLLPTANPQPELGQVADAIYQGRGQQAVVEAVGLHDPALWPAADGIAPHFCTYCVLARLAREHVFEDAFSLNYDCGFEAGLKAEGFFRSPSTLPGRQWRDHATVIADASMNDVTTHPGALVLRKAHGCAEHYREERARAPESGAEEEIVIRASQLLDWRDDRWASETFCERSRRHVLLMLGFSGQDPVINSALRRVLEDVYRTTTPTGNPRVVAIDYQPDTVELRGLIQAGTGPAGPAAGTVTQVCTAGATTTAVTLVLLAEMLALRLHAEMASRGVTLSPQLDHRLAALTLAAPTMLRWSYLLQRPDPSPEFVQRINLQQAAEHGYVPLTHNMNTTALALKTRSLLRAELGYTTPETTQEALEAYGFVMSSGTAYLPTGLDYAELTRACTCGALEQARRVLLWPKNLDCVLVSEDADGRRGVSIQSEMGVVVP